MEGYIFSSILLLSSTFEMVRAQNSFGVGSYGCATNAGITSLAACDALNTTLSSCFAQTTATASILSCFCRQQVLNNIIDCESEYRLCYLSDQFDSLGEGVHSNWDTYCKGFITFSPTTPVLSTPFTTVPTLVGPDQPAYCTKFISSCQIWSASESKCLNINPSATGSSYLQCACATPLLSLASVCFYDRPTSCFSQSVTLTKLPIWSICNVTYSNNNLISINSMGNLTTVPAITTSATIQASSTHMSSASASNTPRTPISTSASTSAGDRIISCTKVIRAAFFMTLLTTMGSQAL